jgi:NAD+ diphosphatase
MNQQRRFAFSVSVHDRASELRTNEAWLAEARRGEMTRVVVVRSSSHLLVAGESHLGHLTPADLPDDAEITFLGLDPEGRPIFVLDAGEDQADAEEDRVRYAELRALTAALPEDEASLAAHAVAMVGWHRRHRFCGICGAQTVAQEAGHSRRCPNCGAVNYPRTDPVVIMLVTAGDRCLLARRSGRRNMWGPLSGFVEPGETFEAAVAREVKEESGLTVVSAEYRGTQPWPFPLSLMIAFNAEAVYEEPHINEELEEARWFTRQEILDHLASGAIALPTPMSVAHYLVRSWLDGE